MRSDLDGQVGINESFAVPRFAGQELLAHCQ